MTVTPPKPIINTAITIPQNEASRPSPINTAIAAAAATIFSSTPPSPLTPIMQQSLLKIDSEITTIIEAAKKGGTSIFPKDEVKKALKQKIGAMRTELERIKKEMTDFEALVCLRHELSDLIQVPSVLFGKEKMELLNLLIEVLEIDPIVNETADGVPETMIKINASLDPKEIQTLKISFQTLLNRTFSAAVELFLHHYRKGYWNALTEQQKKAFIDNQNSLDDINKQENPNLKFAFLLALEASKRLVSDKSGFVEFFDRLTNFATALGKAYSTDLSGFVTEFKAAFQGLDDKLEKRWYKALFEVRFQIQRDPEKKTPHLKDKIKAIQAILLTKQTTECWEFNFGVLDILERLVFNSHEERLIEVSLFGQSILNPITKSSTSNTTRLPGVVDFIELDAEKAKEPLASKASGLCSFLINKLLASREGRETLLDYYHRAKKKEQILKNKKVIKILEKIIPRDSTKWLEEVSSSKIKPTKLAAPYLTIQPASKSHFEPIPEATIAIFMKALSGGDDKLASSMLLKTPDLIYAKDSKKNTAIIVAAGSGNLKLCEMLKKCQTIFTGENSRNAVHSAAAAGHPRIVNYLSKLVKSQLNAKDADGKTPIMLAAENGHDDVVGDLLTNPDVSFKDTDHLGRGILHLAASKGQIKVITVLIIDLVSKRKLDINSRDSSGNTPLLLAAASGHSEMCRLLLRDTEAQHTAQNYDSYSALHLGAENRHLQIVQQFSLYPELINVKTKSGKTALMLGVEADDKAICENIFQTTTDHFAVNNDGLNALHIASKEGKTAIVELFSTNKKLIDARTKDGHTALTLSAQHGKIASWEVLLLSDANPKVEYSLKVCDVYKNFVKLRSAIESTPLMIAASLGKSEMCSTLLEAGAVPGDIDPNGWNAVHFAAVFGFKQVLRNVLFKDKSLLTSKLVSGLTPLMLTAEKGFHESFEMLSRDFNDRYEVCDEDGWNAAHYAANNGREEVIRLFPENAEFLNKANKVGATPLMLSVLSNKPGATIELIKRGVDSNWKDNFGNNVLHLSCLQGITDEVRVLSKYESLRNAQNKSGSTPLMLAKQVEFDIILESKPDLEKKNIQGYNVLHCACQNGELEKVIKILGVNKKLASIPTDCGKTPLQIAKGNNFDAICQELIKADG